MNTELYFHDPLYMAKYAESLYNKPIAKGKKQRNRDQDNDDDQSDYEGLPLHGKTEQTKKAHYSKVVS